MLPAVFVGTTLCVMVTRESTGGKEDKETDRADGCGTNQNHTMVGAVPSTVQCQLCMFAFYRAVDEQSVRPIDVVGDTTPLLLASWATYTRSEIY